MMRSRGISVPFPSALAKVLRQCKLRRLYRCAHSETSSLSLTSGQLWRIFRGISDAASGGLPRSKTNHESEPIKRQRAFVRALASKVGREARHRTGQGFLGRDVGTGVTDPFRQHGPGCR